MQRCHDKACAFRFAVPRSLIARSSCPYLDSPAGYQANRTESRRQGSLEFIMTDTLARFLGGPPLSVLARLVMLSLIVGALLMWLEIHPAEIIDAVERLFRRLWNLGFGAVRVVLEYVVAGAVIVVPIWLVLRLLNAGRGTR